MSLPFNKNKISFSVTRCSNVKQTGHKAFFGKGDSWKDHVFNSEILQIHWRISSIFFYRTTGLISAKLGNSFQGEIIFKKSDEFWCIWHFFLQHVYWPNLNQTSMSIFYFQKEGNVLLRFVLLISALVNSSLHDC